MCKSDTNLFKNGPADAMLSFFPASYPAYLDALCLPASHVGCRSRHLPADTIRRRRERADSAEGGRLRSPPSEDWNTGGVGMLYSSVDG